jgi:hypothetical protein
MCTVTLLWLRGPAMRIEEELGKEHPPAHEKAQDESTTEGNE